MRVLEDVETRAALRGVVESKLLPQHPSVAVVFWNSLVQLAYSELDESSLYEVLAARLVSLLGSRYERDVSHLQERTARRVQRILHLQPGSPAGNYLDFGGGNGAITELLGLAWGLPRSRVLLLDVEHDGTAHANTTRISYDEHQRFPVPRESVGLITALMALHHVENLPATFSEMQRVLLPGGTIILREHDAETERDHDFFDAQDKLQSWVFNSNPTAPVPGHYFSAPQWRQFLTLSGFVVSSVVRGDPADPQRTFYLVASKPPSSGQ